MSSLSRRYVIKWARQAQQALRDGDYARADDLLGDIACVVGGKPLYETFDEGPRAA